MIRQVKKVLRTLVFRVSLPRAFYRWWLTTSRPWENCDRLDWLVLLASLKGYNAPQLIAALAKMLRRTRVPQEFALMNEVAEEVRVAYASGHMLSHDLRSRFHDHVMKQAMEWNMHTQSPFYGFPESLPPENLCPPCPDAAKELWETAHALSWLTDASDAFSAGDQRWPWPVALASLSLLFVGRGGSALYNYVHMKSLPPELAAASQQACTVFRASLT